VYPERDYWLLISALVATMNPATVGGDVWRYFAKFSAQRDIGGQSKKAAPGDTAAGAGVYRSFAAVETTDLENFFRLASRLWSQYHDTGRMEVIGAHPESNTVVMRLSGFTIPIEGFVRLQGYYLEEYAQLIGISMVSRVTKSTASGAAFCEWQHQLARSPATEAFVASLPVVTDAETGSGGAMVRYFGQSPARANDPDARDGYPCVRLTRISSRISSRCLPSRASAAFIRRRII
jgi:hypothetical protein